MIPQKNEGIYDANGEERIELRGPAGVEQTVWYKARTRDGGRGLARPKLILDEAFALKAAMMGSLVPIMLAQYQPQMLLGSSPGKSDSEVLFDVRKRGRAGSSPMMTYVEWEGEEPICYSPSTGEVIEDCDHPKSGFANGDPCAYNRIELITKANPAVAAGRMPLENLDNARQSMPTEEWLRECMARWDEPDTGAAATFGPGRWEACAGEPEEWPEKPAALGLAVSVDRTFTSISSASMVEILEDPSDPEAEPVDRIFVAATDRREGVTWAIAECKRIQDETDCVIIVDEKGPTKDLLADLEEADVAVETVNLDEYAEACARFFDKVRERRVLHPSSAELDDAVSGATWRTVGDRQVWGRRKSTTDVSMLEAATLAVHGVEKFAW